MENQENRTLQALRANYKAIIVEEIALEGLEGIGLDLLWRRLEYRLSCPLPVKTRSKYWRYILSLKSVSLYQLPEPLPHVELIDRFTIVDESSGNLKNPDVYLDGPYEYHPAMGEFGSSKFYTTRKLIPSSQFANVDYEKVLTEYEDTLVMVASREERWRALAPHKPVNYLYQVTQIQYCILELIGKGRENGQMTTGLTNLTKIIKEPKNLFYNRKLLKDLGLIRVLYITQHLGNRGIKSLLLRLIKYHQPEILSMPKHGKIYNIVQYLKNQPNYCDRADAMWKNSLVTCIQTKKLKKTMNVFEFEDKTIKLEELPRNKSKASSASLFRKRSFIKVAPPSDDSDHSDEENNEIKPIKCQYKVGVGLLRQAYERFLDGGLRGLNQLELAQLLGVEFYTGRTICRIFKARKIVREFYEDRGKQRVTRYVAVAAGQADSKYTKEAQTFLDYTKNTEATTSQNEDVEMTTEGNNDESSNHITEIRSTEENLPNMISLLESKTLTLRQLRFANGILKIVNERQCVTGYQTLSNLVSKEINEPPMVTKALKSFIQKIVSSGQLKIYKVRWPGAGNEHNFSNLICAPHIKKSHPIVRAKYKEVYLRAAAKKRPTQTTTTTAESSCRPLSMFVNPRYMKIQCLHEFLFKMAYYDLISTDQKLGIMSVTELMPEMSVKFAISNMSVNGMSDISDLRIQECHLNMKLKDTPPEISHFIIKSKSLRNAIRQNLKILAMHGLIQLLYVPFLQTTDYSNSQLNSFLFYVNRNARIVNTSGQWPRPNVNVASLERTYHFENINDVKTYWNDVYEISVATEILLTDRTKKKINPPIRREEDIQLFDNGDRYGDGGGPCGFDSCFYMEISRLWQTFYVRTLKPRNPIVKKKEKSNIKIPKLAKSNLKKPRAPRKKKVVNKVNPIMKIKAKIKNRKKIADDTVFWTKEEDNIITMCQAAITIASPTSQPGSLKVRNIVAKDILSRNDPKKTQSACHRRALVIQTNPTMVHDKDSLLNEMRRRRHLIHKYEGMIRKLRLRYSTNMSKFINESRLPMLELIYLIWQVSISESYLLRMPCVAINARDFHENYTIVPATASKYYNLYRSPDLAALRESVFVSIMLSYNSEVRGDTAKKIYSIFKEFPESDLRTVVDQLRKCGAVSAKEKIFNNQMHRLHLEDVVQSVYKISANYQRRWIGRLNSEFVTSLGKVIGAGLPQSEFKGSAEMNCLISELHGSDLIEVVSANHPVIVGTREIKLEQNNAFDIETKFKLKSGTVKWRNRPGEKKLPNLAALYDVEFISVLQNIAKNSVLHIKENLDETYNTKDAIVIHLLEKGESGLTFNELQELTSYDTKSLITRLSQLESLNVVKRVGFVNNVLIHAKFMSHYAIKIDNRYAINTPWMNLNSEIRHDVFLEWAGVIVNKIFEYPGTSFTNLSDCFELITTRAVQDICMFLEKTKCITLSTLKLVEQDLFSDEDAVSELSEFNPYGSPDEMVAFPVKDSLTRYAYLRKAMLDPMTIEISMPSNKVSK